MESRTKNVAKNASVGLIMKIIIFIMQFVCRTIFIKALSTEYLGVNGLFSNILTMLSFAELGIGNAIIFKLYKPIAEDNKEKVKTYLNFYKKAYVLIGITILAIGICIIPFLKYIVTDAPNISENITLLYVLFLINSSVSYFFTYKRSIIYGYQKEYIATFRESIIVITQNILQIIFLLLTHNYIVYLIIQLLATVAQNIWVSKKAEKMYPYIKEKKYEKISKEEEKNILKDVKSLVLYRLGSSISNGTDNIIISSFIGVSEVGLLSNYTTITNAITSFTSVIFNGFTASVGNLNVSKDKQKKQNIFYQILLMAFYVYGFISIMFTALANDFIEIWLGKDYLFDLAIVIALGLNLYVEGIRYPSRIYRDTMGLFKEGRWMPLLSSIANVILSLILVKPLGVFGVLIATVIARLIIMTWYDPYIIHKFKFESKFRKYVIRYCYYFFIITATFLIGYKIIRLISINGIAGFIIKAIILALIIIIIFILFTFKLKEFKGLFERIKNKIKGGKNNVFKS